MTTTKPEATPPTRHVRLPSALLARAEKLRKAAEKAAGAEIAESAYVAALVEDGIGAREKRAAQASRV